MPSYALVTPARNEIDNLPRLALSLAAQRHLPEVWVIVDSGSTDETASVARALAEEYPWIELDGVHASADGPTRANATLRAFESGVETLAGRGDVVVKLDADVSFAGDYFERLMSAFADDPQLGMASGTCYELEVGAWQQRHVTGDHVWGASRAYRRACLDDVWPLEDNLAWDRVDEVKAALAGWRTATLTDLPFYHHRPEGAREGSRANSWNANGRSAHYLGYRFQYLVLRSLNHARRDPYALAMISGYVRAAAGGERSADRDVKSYIRREQSLRRLPLRVREARGKGS